MYLTEVTQVMVASVFLCTDPDFGGEEMVKINGKACNIAGKTLADYLAGTSYDSRRIAVERNGNIVPKAQYRETVLMDGDSIEVVSFVGGG